MKKIFIFEHEYCAEGLIDVEQDISEAIDVIPSDEDGFKPGTFKVTVEWIPND
jgi:hypothetical protein